MSYTTVRFEPIPRRAVKNLPCPGCGKKVRRQRTFTMTQNPFNKDPETGLPRTFQQIWAALGVECAEWESQPETCTTCQDAAGGAS
jgi:hypothetical protein